MRIAWIRLNDDGAQGYGKIGMYLAGALREAGAELVPFRDYDWDIRCVVGGPRAWLIGKGDHVVRDLAWHTMFEAHPLPPDWTGVLNRSAGVWVPAQWNVEVFRESGVTCPIYVGGYGVNPAEFHPMRVTRDEDAPYVFIWCGYSLGDGRYIGDRKGGELVIEAFRKLNLPDSRLILKAHDNSAIQTIDGDDRITLIVERLPIHDYAALIASADCFVYPSHGEGFGLQPLEAMAIGLPVIAPTYSGMTEFITEDVAIPLPVRGEERATLYEQIYEAPCWWASLSVDDVADRMKWCYEHREEAAAIGRRAAEYVAERWTWDKAGQRGIEILKNLMEV